MDREQMLLQHRRTGECYVADTDGVAIYAATGPLHHSEIKQALSGDYDSDPDVVFDLTAHPENYLRPIQR